MIIQCGTDIIEVERVKDAIENMHEKFLNKVYTENEISYCNSKNKAKYQHYAARFAAKEAIFKAVSSRLNDKYELIWTDVEIINDENGKPFVNILKESLKSKVDSIDISLSHIKEYAIANCIVVFK